MTARTARDLGAFFATGLATVAVDATVLILTHSGLGWPLAPATAVAFAASIAVNFLGHRSWAGRDARNGLLDHAGRYGVLLAVNLAITIVTVTGLTAVGLYYLISKGVAIVLTSSLSFIAYKRWVFR